MTRRHPGSPPCRHPDWTELRLVANSNSLPFSSWAFAGHPGPDICQRLLLDGLAIENADQLRVNMSYRSIDGTEASKLGLPPPDVACRG